MSYPISEETRQHIREMFPDIVFPNPVFKPVNVTGNDGPESRFVAVYDEATEHTFAIVSQKYNIIRHEDVLFRALDECSVMSQQFGMGKVDVRMKDNGARMSYDILWPEYKKDVKLHDHVSPLFHGVNSYDLSSSLMSEYGAYRLICENEMIAGNIEDTVRMRHIGYASAENIR
jgi:hypothetical protein